ncbi:hypothetical protein J6590_098722 [Homalodisca vitripennis]|nr:hypothetical protein J6590_098722 [Homalodisca vitripennis]
MKVSTPSDSSHATDCRRGPATRRGKESRIRHTCPLPALDGYSLAPHSPPAKLAHYHNETETSGFVTSGEILLGCPFCGERATIGCFRFLSNQSEVRGKCGKESVIEDWANVPSSDQLFPERYYWTPQSASDFRPIAFFLYL